MIRLTVEDTRDERFRIEADEPVTIVTARTEDGRPFLIFKGLRDDVTVEKHGEGEGPVVAYDLMDPARFPRDTVMAVGDNGDLQCSSARDKTVKVSARVTKVAPPEPEEEKPVVVATPEDIAPKPEETPVSDASATDTPPMPEVAAAPEIKVDPEPSAAVSPSQRMPQIGARRPKPPIRRPQSGRHNRIQPPPPAQS